MVVVVTMTALLAGFQNFGTQMARTTGVAALSWFSIRAELSDDFPGETCDFTNMPYLLFAAHFICPLLTVPLTFILIPDANMKDDLEPESYGKPSDEPKSKTDGGSAYQEIKDDAKTTLLPQGSKIDQGVLAGGGGGVALGGGVDGEMERERRGSINSDADAADLEGAAGGAEPKPKPKPKPLPTDEPKV